MKSAIKPAVALSLFGMLLGILCYCPANAQEKALPTFKPGDTAVLTITFSEKLPPNSKISIGYQWEKAETEGEINCSRNDSIRWDGGSSDSKDNQTFVINRTIGNDVRSGIYKFSGLSVDSPGFSPGGSSQAQTATEIAVRNTPCPKPVQVPSFDITVKH